MKLLGAYLLALVFTTMLQTGCSKGSGSADPNDAGLPHVNNPGDTIPPVVVISAPTANQVYRSGDVLTVSGRVTDENGLYQGSIRITNDATGALVRDQQYVIHYITDYSYNITHTLSVTTASDYTVTVSFEDHGQNVVTKTVKIRVNP
jgi:hypothetical protein